jgi:hypothetical protein
MMNALRLTIGVLALISSPVHAGPTGDDLMLAQQQSQPADAAPRQESAQPQSGQPAGRPKDGKRSKDRFKPSERIRADSPVSFPVDI